MEVELNLEKQFCSKEGVSSKAEGSDGFDRILTFLNVSWRQGQSARSRKRAGTRMRVRETQLMKITLAGELNGHVGPRKTSPKRDRSEKSSNHGRVHSSFRFKRSELPLFENLPTKFHSIRKRH
jgi:hypothetical protein